MYFFSVFLPLMAAASSNGLMIPRGIEAGTQDPSSKNGFVTTFFDDFTVTPGAAPSSSNWIVDIGTSYPGGATNWGTNEIETYTNSRENLVVTAEHTLTITPRQQKNGTWTSGRIETQRSDFVAAPGGKLYIETRLKLGSAAAAQQQGIWAAFWALGEEFRGVYTNWPQATEWDIMENVDGQPNIFNTLHCGTAPGGPCNELSGINNAGIAQISRVDFHTYGFQVDRSMVGPGLDGTWMNETLTWILDGQTSFNVTGARVGNETVWAKIAHQAHFLLLNVAVGGSFPGPPNGQTANGTTVQMEVDYVGVYNSRDDAS